MRFERTIYIAAPRERVWSLLAHTDRLNREMGLPAVRFGFVPRAQGGSDITALARIGPISLHYQEHPFEWARPSFFTETRTFHGGPLREVRLSTHLEPRGDGTSLTVRADLDQANAASIPIVAAIGRKSLADFVAACRSFEAFLKNGTRSPYPRHAGAMPADSLRLDQAVGRLVKAGADEALAVRFGTYIADSPAEMVTTIRPFALADEWSVDRGKVLRLCLLAAGREVGMLDLRWRVLCPSCRGSAVAVRMGGITADVHCESCNIRYDAAFDESVEVVFAVAPAIRPVHVATYCIGGPMLHPHVEAQWVVQPSASSTFAAAAPGPGFVLTSLQSVTRIEVGDEADCVASACAVLAPSDGRAALRLEPQGARTGPGTTWTIRNETGAPATVRLESTEGVRDAASAAFVTSLQEFRDRFSSEVLSPGAEIAVRQICILFSDLRGSTAMYRSRGDAPSYRAVRDHFDSMRRIVARHDGGIVKTIGDAIMAAFADPVHALQAAIDIQRDARKDPNGLVVKLGLHWGPAIAVTANDLLDYFGQTVNLASRLQQESSGGDIVLAAELAHDARIAEVLRSESVTSARFTAVLRGYSDHIEMVRVVPKD